MTASLEDFFAALRARFPGLVRGAGAGRVPLNNAAGSEMPEAAIEAMATWIRSNFVNEGVTFPRLEASRGLAREARAATADLLGARPEEVGFGANTTTNLFYISRAVARTFQRGDRILISEACHEANIAPWLALADYGLAVDFIPMRPDTHIDYEWLEANIDERTRLVSVGMSSNGTGTIHDVARVARAARRVGALVSLDAAHYVPHRPVSFEELDADLLFFSLYKCFGPHLGAFCVRQSLCERLPPFGMPWPEAEQRTAVRFEAGTRSFESLAGWLATLEYLADIGTSCPRADADAPAPARRRDALAAGMDALARWEEELTRYGDERLRAVPGIELYMQDASDARPRLGVFCFNLKGRPTAEVARALANAGIEAVMGHNGAMRTMQKLTPDTGGSGIRLSLAHYNTRADIDRAVDCLLAIAS